MGWQIANLDNTVVISDDVAKQLADAQEYEDQYWWGGGSTTHEGVTYEGHMCFDSDAQEHQDSMLWDDAIMRILKVAKVEGRITFGSLDGDDFGKFWGWDFDGQGGVQTLSGNIKWETT